MKRLIIILLCTLDTIVIHAQNWCPSGAQWYYTADCLQMTNGYYHLYYDGDTTINAINCKIIQKDLIYKDILGNPVVVSKGREYTYADNDKVFIYRFNNFYPLYDFSVQTGDTINIYGTNYYTNCDSISSAHVTNTGFVTINNETLRFYELTQLNNDTPEWSHDGMIIEKIGHVNTYFLPTKIDTCGIIGFDSGCESGFFRCYQDNSFGIYSIVTPLSCDYMLSSFSPEDKQNIYPNPGTGIFTIEIEDVQSIKNNIQCKVFDISGKEVYNKTITKNQSTVNIEHLKDGMYFIKLMGEGYNASKKIVLQR